MIFSVAKYPGDSVIEARLRRGNELGSIVVQKYFEDRYRVASFIPGRSVCVEGDIPKTEPERSEWTTTISRAGVFFQHQLADALAQGWRSNEVAQTEGSR